MRSNKAILIFLQIIFVALIVIIFSSCSSMQITFSIKDKPTAEKKPEPPPQPKKEVKVDIPAEEKPADKVSTPPKEEKPVEKAPEQQVAKETTPKEEKHEKLALEGTILIEKNHYYVLVPGSDKRYRLIGLQKEEKSRLNELQRKTVRLEIQVVSTESAKFYNAHLISIGEVIASQQEIAKETPAKKEKPKEKAPKQEVAKETKPKEEKPEEIAASEKKPQEVTLPHKINEIIKIAGFVSVEKKDYYIKDPQSEIQYRLINLKKEEMNQLKKLKGQKTNLELQVISNDSAKACSVQLIRFI